MATERARRILDRMNKQKNPAAISNLDQEIIQRLEDIKSALTKENLDDGKDYMTVVREFMAKHGADMLTAQREIDKIYPHLRREYIKKYNPGLDID